MNTFHRECLEKVGACEGTLTEIANQPCTSNQPCELHEEKKKEIIKNEVLEQKRETRFHITSQKSFDKDGKIFKSIQIYEGDQKSSILSFKKGEYFVSFLIRVVEDINLISISITWPLIIMISIKYHLLFNTYHLT